MKKLFVLGMYFLAAGFAAAQAPKLIGKIGAPTGGTTAPIDSTGANAAIFCGNSDTGVSDSQGNKFPVLVSQGGYNGNRADIAAAFGLTTSTKHTFTNHSGRPFTVLLFSNLASPDQVAKSATLSPPQTMSLTPNAVNELVVMCTQGAAAPSANPREAPSSPFTAGSVAQGKHGWPFEYTTADAYLFTGANGQTKLDGAIDVFQGNGQASAMASFYSVLTPVAPTVTVDDPLPEAAINATYKEPACPTGHGGVQPFSYAVTGLPAGMNFDAKTGCVTGRPTGTVTDAAVSWQLTDAKGEKASAAAHLSVAAAAITLAGTTCPRATQLQPYSCSALRATGGIGKLHYSASTDPDKEGMPGGISVDPDTGTISSARVMDQGNYPNLGFAAYDDHGGKVSASLKIDIAGDNTIGKVQLFPADSVYHLKVRDLPNDPTPLGGVPGYYHGVPLKAMFGPDDETGGFVINTVPANEPFVPVKADNGGNQFTSGPFPCTLGIEGDRNEVLQSEKSGEPDLHALVVYLPGVGADGRPHPAQLYETYNVYPEIDKNGKCSWGNPSDPQGGGYGSAVFPVPGSGDSDVQTTYRMPNPGATVDAAGLPVTPLLLNYDEVAGGCAKGHECGVVRHPIRIGTSHLTQYFQWPATASAPDIHGNCPAKGVAGGDIQEWDPAHPRPCFAPDGKPVTTQGDSGPVAGQIYHLPPGTAEPGECASNPVNHIIFQAIVDYGLIVADRSGSSSTTGGLMGTKDARWPEWGTLNGCLNRIHMSQLVVAYVAGTALDPSYRSSQVKVSRSSPPPAVAQAPAQTQTQTQTQGTKDGHFTILETRLPNATVGTAYQFCPAATGGKAPYDWDETGSLPAGITWLGRCISGTPTAAGTTTGITFKATDASGGSATSTAMSLVVKAAGGK